MSGNQPVFLRFSDDGLTLEKMSFDFIDESTYFTYANGLIGIVVPGSIGLAIANSTANINIAIPTDAQKAGGYFLHANGQFAIPAGGGGSTSPGGSNTYVQFNDSGSFNGTAGLAFVKTTNTLLIGNSTVNATINSTVFSGTANNTSFVGSETAANIVSNAQLQANLSSLTSAFLVTLDSYQTEAGLAGNVATLTANNTAFVGTVTAANVVSNAQLQANLANYLTLAGLAANVTTVTANNTLFVGTVTAANVVSNAQLQANLANYLTLAGLAANVTTVTANNTLFVGTVTAANVVSNAQLIANLANYALTSSLSAYALLASPTFSGTVSVGANVTVNTTMIFVGNSTVNATMNSSVFALNGVAVSGSGSPGGSNTYVQFNDSSSFGGTAGLVFNKTSNTLSIGNSTVSATVNSTIFSATALLANNASFLGAVGAANTNMATIGFVIDGGGATITTGMKGYIEVPFGCTINRVTLLGDQSGSIVVDIFKCTYSAFDPTTTPASGNKITASAPPTISSAKKAQDSTLTGWTTTIVAGDILAFNVNSVTTIQRVTVSLKVTKT